ncbi:MAG: lipoyl synthase [Candidatus Electryonea clarkiae]|nr:lipoyl synthase [Candidatus Electryonea clarkiae]MDP8285071.1 lipoyl synthase [Candidatus Electryonea clarkiae]
MKADELRKPRWIRTVWQQTAEAKRVRSSLRELQLNTVCEESSCPNRGECYNSGTCTFLIMGSICTRGCRFCDVTSGHPTPLDPLEPKKVAESIHQLNLKYVVITSVDRDDLADYGADHFAATIDEIRNNCPGVGIEVLTPDFQGNAEALKTVLNSKPDVFAHNLETVRRLTPLVRDQRADYDVSLSVFRLANTFAPDIPVKTGLMVGLGETDEEILESISNAFDAGARSITIGQYLRPGKHHLQVQRFVNPEIFDGYAQYAYGLGYSSVASGPMVRSSYRAEEMFSKRLFKTEKTA